MWGGFSPMLAPHTFPQTDRDQMVHVGHNIPMIGEERPRDAPFIAQPMPPLPSTDYLPDTDGVDWALVASCSPEEVAESNDVDTLSAVIQTFVRAKFTQTEAQLMPNPLTAKLFRLLQIGTNYLLDCQAELQSDLDDKMRMTDMLNRKMKSMGTAITKAKSRAAQRERSTEQTEKCVVCGRRFKTVAYLDAHMQRRHAALVPAWRSLRSGQMQGMDDVMEQIDGLRQEVAKAHFAFERREQERMDAPAKAAVPVIVHKTDEQVRLMKEHMGKHEEALEQGRLQEEKQQRFMQEMRNQLDEAVLALRQSQKQMMERSQISARLPSMPDLGKTAEDDLAASLTTRIMQDDVRTRKQVMFDIDRAMGDPDDDDIRSAPTREAPAVHVPLVDPVRLKKALERDEDTDAQCAVSRQTDVKEPGMGGESQHESDSDNRPLGAPRRKKEVLSVREMKAADIMARIQADEDEHTALTGPQVAAPGESYDDVMRRAERLATGRMEIDPAHKTAQVAIITADVLRNVDTQMARLQSLRRYAPLSHAYVERTMRDSTQEYKRIYEQMKLFVAVQAPLIEDFRDDLFRERETRFPLLPQLQLSEAQRGKKGKHLPPGVLPAGNAVLPQSGATASPSKAAMKLGGVVSGALGAMQRPGQNRASAIQSAVRKFPYVQRQGMKRPLGMGGGSDVEEVDFFSSEVDSSEVSVAFMDDPDFYRRGRMRDSSSAHVSAAQQDHDLIGEISSEIKPLAEMKQIDMDDIAGYSSGDDDAQPPPKKPQPQPKPKSRARQVIVADDESSSFGRGPRKGADQAKPKPSKQAILPDTDDVSSSIGKKPRVAPKKGPARVTIESDDSYSQGRTRSNTESTKGKSLTVTDMGASFDVTKVSSDRTKTQPSDDDDPYKISDDDFSPIVSGSDSDL